MVNEDIVTSLQNSIERGENLENAINILKGSGYPLNEIQEASKYVGQGVMSNLQPTPEEDIPIQPSLSQRGKISDLTQKNSQLSQEASPDSNQSQQLPKTPQIPQTSTQLAQTPLDNMHKKEMPKVKIKKKSHKKEIMLAVILLILILILGATFLFKDKILSFFG